MIDCGDCVKDGILIFCCETSEQVNVKDRWWFILKVPERCLAEIDMKLKHM